MGLDVYLYHGEECIEIDSAKYPDHLFKVGYFRSSYNEGGFNHVVRDLIGIDLGDIFDTDNQYELNPDWNKAKSHAEESLKMLREKIEKFPYRASCVSHNVFGQPKLSGSDEAMRVFENEMGRKNRSGDYSSINGLFLFEHPMEVIAAIPGDDLLGGKGIYLIYKCDDLDWYCQAIEIVIETCDYVLSQGDKASEYTMHWSG